MNNVMVILTNVSSLGNNTEETTKIIADKYSSKYISIKNKLEAKQALATGLLLKRYLEIDKDEDFLIGKYGKPRLLNQDIHFNISHSNEYVALAISSIPIGIDIEKITKVSWQAAKKVFDSRRFENLEKANENEKATTFTKLWTEIEAELKLAGTGFAGEIKDSYEEEKFFLNSKQHEEYIITCATYEKSTALVKEVQIDEKFYSFL